MSSYVCQEKKLQVIKIKALGTPLFLSPEQKTKQNGYYLK